MAETPNDVYNNHNNQGRMVGGSVHGTVNQGDQHNYYHNTVNDASQQEQGILDALTASLVSATHIANASDGPIWAKCDRDQAKLTCDSDILEGLSLGGRTQERLAEKGFCKINRGDFLKMIPPAPFWDRFTRHTTVYISVFYADENGNLKKNGGTSSVEANKSVIVTKNNIVIRTKMGSLWKGEDDVNYSIRRNAD